MSSPEDRIRALEETVERIKNAWYVMSEERARLIEENQVLRGRVSEMEGRMQAIGDMDDLRAGIAQQSSEMPNASVADVKKEIKNYIAEIDQCIEWLNSI